MELEDLDLSGCWPLDQIAFASTLRPPLVFSSSDQPCSPLWTFSDAASASGDAAQLYSASASATAGPPPRFPDYSVYLACTPGSAAENAKEYGDNKIIPSPFWGMMPLENPDSHCAIKARMSQALRNLKESTGQQHLLAQVWAPVESRGRYVLTTSGQPFVLGPNSNGLNQYRMVSLTYMFSVDNEMDGELGLPGRVFRQKLPEWTPNVQYYSSKEFSRLVHALNYNVQGTLALPVFEPARQLCVGVIELIMTSPKINYAPEVEKVCKALEAVNLKTSEILNHETTQICNEGRQNALADILEILTVVCETYKLPLAQTWVPCRHRNVLAYGGGFKKNCSSFDGSCMGKVCMSTSDLAFYVVDAHMWGFRDACAEHHLQKGQGVAGRAFRSASLCFCSDVTRFCKIDYPLVHYARMFNLTSCFAICLQSAHTGDDEYVLEFFLPPGITGKGEQDCILGSLLATMKQHLSSLKVASGVELCENEASVEIIQASEDGTVYSRLEPIPICHLEKSTPSSNNDLQLNASEEKLFLETEPTDNSTNQTEKSSIIGDFERCETPNPLLEVKATKKSERKRGKTEKTISLEVLQRYFAGSLKDAAKSLGVCPTTMKRICRQHGISRWPSRKINKVNRSLTRLKHVIDSVQGADGAIDLTSFSSRPLPVVVVGSGSWPPNLNTNSHHISPTENQRPENSWQGCRSPGSFVHDVKTENRDAEDSAGSSTSRGFCEGSPISRTRFQLPKQQDAQEAFRQTPFEDWSSSKDPSNLWTEPRHNTSPLTVLHTRDKQGTSKPVSIKATYREDIIRFKISPNSGVTELKQEVGKRLKLETGTFEVKYLDDDKEWVSVSCDADLCECLDTSTGTVRLSVHEVIPNFGSSCESSEEL